MADNVTLPGTGDLIAADDCTTAGKAQIMKLAISTDGSATLIPADAANGIDVDVTRLPVVTGSGSLTAQNNAVTLTLGGAYANATFQLTGTWSASVTFEASNDNTNWSTIYAYKAGDGVIYQTVTNSTLNDIYRCTVSGFGYVRARCSAYTSGTIVVTAFAGSTTSGVFQNFPQQPSAALAVAHGTAPTEVAAGVRVDSPSNRAGIPFTIGGHPNVVTVKHANITTAVTDTAVITVGAGTKIVVTAFTFTLDNASTVFPTVLMGFGATTTPTTTGVIAAHGGVPAGGGFSRGDGSGILGIGGDGEDLRITTTGNATGNGLQLVVTYYTVSS